MKKINLSPFTQIFLGILFALCLSCSKDSDLLSDYVISDTEIGLNGNFIVDDTFFVYSNGSVVLDVLANDNFQNQEEVTITTTSTPSNGTVVINENNTLTYTPSEIDQTESETTQEDTFDYTTEVVNADATVTSEVGSVTVTTTNRSFDFNVHDFGAKGDGITDDRAALQATLDAAGNAASSTNKKTVYLPSGEYLLFKSGNTRLNMRANVILIGDGENSVLTITPDNEKNWGNILRIKEINNWELRNLVIDGNSGPTQFGGTNNVAGDESQGVANIYIGNSDNFIVDNVVNRNSWYNAIQVTEATNGIFSNNKIINTDCGIITYGDVSNVDVVDNLFDGHHWSEPIAFYFGNFDNINIRGNTIKNKGYSHGIIVGKEDQPNKTHKNINIQDNTIDKTNNGIKVKHGINSNVVISGNTVFVENEGIDLSNCSNCSLIDNEVNTSWGGVNFISPGINGIYKELSSNAGQDAIALLNNTRLLFTGNTITSFGYECIDVDNTTFLENKGNTCP